MCRVCAARAGVERICDRDFSRRIAERAARVEPWWRWTIYLEHALSWAEHDRDRSPRKLRIGSLPDDVPEDGSTPP
jgi:hypothetical protein